VLQRWYGFADRGVHQAASRQSTSRVGPRALRNRALRLPFQPVVKCDRLPDAALSCRAYNEPGQFVFLEEGRSTYRWRDGRRWETRGGDGLGEALVQEGVGVQHVT
jgi:hypothetical protein